MKKVLFILLLTIPFVGFGQSMTIKWDDYSGVEFEINSHSGKLSYTVPSGGDIKYNTGSLYDSGPNGTIKSIGRVDIKYNTGSLYDSGPNGTIKSVGGVDIKYNTGSLYDSGPEGTIKSVGGLDIKYNTGSLYDSGPKGSVKSTSGSVQ